MKHVAMIFIGCLVTGVPALNCGKILPNRNPVISSVFGSDTVSASGNISLICSASDPNGDKLTYSWSVSSGSLSSSSGSSIIWYAPNKSGSANITVTVRDGRGGIDTQTKTITVKPFTTILIQWSGAVQAGSFTNWKDTIEAGCRIYGNFSVDVHDINFLVLDESNVENWRNNRSYNYLVRVSRSTGSSFSATVWTKGVYYFIFDNSYSLFTDKFAHLSVKTTSP